MLDFTTEWLRASLKRALDRYLRTRHWACGHLRVAGEREGDCRQCRGED